MPRGPGVISAMATIFDTSVVDIQPWDSISSLITGTMDMPPKLVNPIFINTKNKLRSSMAFVSFSKNA